MPPSRKGSPKPRTNASRQTWICLLRGINVGGHGKVSMAELRALCAELGALQPETYIQSGNVIFEAAGLDERAFSIALETALLGRFAVRTAAVFRSLDELREMVAINPFPAEAAEAPSKLAVTFLRDLPSEEAVHAIPREGPTGEQLHIVGKHLFTYFPQGMGQSKLNFAALDRTLATPGTARNWNTVLKLLSMADARQH